ncbi:hypothetical protein ACFYY8_17725 [Streptosporangium sp. NPDC001559]|uniref:hypothetical protein n=1 Tax=Streptosporangium sp. NPDC001559 TaxID=3366187 RepID=UPI0036E1F738
MTAIPSLTLRRALLIVDAVNGMDSADRLANTRLPAQEWDGRRAGRGWSRYSAGEHGRSRVRLVFTDTTRQFN